MKLFSSKRRVAAAAALILVLLFLLRPGASRLKSRIVLSMSAAVGRAVDIGSVHLRLLPRPGFDLENLVVYDDPSFGAEPMLRASEVTADLRLTSIVRGRLEIARLELTEPSLNLVHGENGRWNLEALLERTAHTPLAPTGKAKSEPRPAFPYIEATSARINFKSGPEKKPYALANADFSLWQESENTWGVRLKAQPMRTDLALNDMGTLQLSGTWQRADALRDTPLHLTVEWSRAQLGQLTKFLTGNDQGWRGGVQIDATLSGTPAKLQITSAASVQDFRRYDITSGGALRLGAQCDAQYSSIDHVFHDLACNAPVTGGIVSLKGETGFPGSRRYKLTLTAERVPAGALVALARHAKKNLPEDLVAGGLLRGSVEMEEDPASAKVRFEGRGEIADFRLASAADKAEIGSQKIPIVLTTGDSSANTATHRKTRGGRAPGGPHIEFGPFPAGIGRAAAPEARGWVNRAGYDISLTGETDVAKALRLARLFGVPAPQTVAEGAAQVDLQIAGAWTGAQSGFSGPQVTGTAKLKNVRVTVNGVGGPVEISSADVQLLPDAVRVGRLNATAAGTAWTGSLEMPRGCGTPGACQVRFNLSANQVGLSELSAWASPRPKERAWYQVLGSTAQAGPSFLGTLRAAGHVSVERLPMHTVVATHVSAEVSVDTGKVQIRELTADFLGGKHRGEWQGDFSSAASVCRGTGSISGLVLTRAAGAIRDDRLSGTASATYEVKGSCPADFWSSAEGTLQFDVRDGTLGHISLVGEAGLLRITSFAGKAHLHAGALEIQDAKLDSPSGKFHLDGTASLKGDLDFKLANRSAHGATYTITGKVSEPRVVQMENPETQARLKTEAPKQ